MGYVHHDILSGSIIEANIIYSRFLNPENPTTEIPTSTDGCRCISLAEFAQSIIGFLGRQAFMFRSALLELAFLLSYVGFRVLEVLGNWEQYDYR